MRVLFFNWEYPPQGSGIGRYNELLTTALRQQGHFCVIATSSTPQSPKEEVLENGRLYRLCPPEDMRKSETIERVLALAQEHRVDLIEGADHLGHCAGLLRIQQRPPLCIKLHYNDVLHELRYAQAAYPWQRFLIYLACLRQHQRLAAERFSITQADHLTAPGKAIMQQALRQGLILPQSRTVLPNPVEIPANWENREAAQPTLLLVGRIDFGKGIQYIPQILKQVRKNFPQTVVELAGPDCSAKGIGSLLHWLYNHIPPGAVRSLGLLNRQDLDKAYQRAWVVLSPSRWDTFPNTVLEAMARSKPLVVSPHGGAQEMLAGTKNIIARPDSPDFAEAICRVLADRSLRQRLGQQARRKAETAYSPSLIAERYVRWFEERL